MSREPIVEQLRSPPDSWELAQSLSFRSHLLFLDSSDRHYRLGRYSFVSCDPVEWIEIPRVDHSEADPIEHLRQRLSRYEWDNISGLPPFQGGLAGLLGYGLGHAIERFPRSPVDEFEVPDIAVGIYDWVVAYDHELVAAWIIARSSAALRAARECIALRHSTLPTTAATWSAIETSARFPLAFHADVSSNFSRSAYLDAVRRAIEYVHAGDSFQVNVAQRLLSPLREPALELYGRLRERNPSPFGGCIDLGNFFVASASPERFLCVDDGRVETRPIKGTRPRMADAEADRGAAAALASSPKDRAENVMIVDLLRNDLGRVCDFGSIGVPQVCEVESYRYVHHLVSAVTGRLKRNRTVFDLIRAAFPGGSVTGAPKVRALEIISELEPTERGPYCGCLGYIGNDGVADFNILIRTFVIGKGWVQFPVGGGIVADSDPQREYEETLHKAAGMLSALQPKRG